MIGGQHSEEDFIVQGDDDINKEQKHTHCTPRRFLIALGTRELTILKDQ